jgi:hypothetical protein
MGNMPEGLIRKVVEELEGMMKGKLTYVRVLLRSPTKPEKDHKSTIMLRQ